MDTKVHWENVYQTKEPTEVSWYQSRPEMSLEFIEKTAVGKDAAILDVGGGTSTLVDHLIRKSYRRISVLDISAAAIEKSKKRLFEKIHNVQWLTGDIMQIALPPAYFARQKETQRFTSTLRFILFFIHIHHSDQSIYQR
jgi:2-polyprenyl-3-methyl-5-hydroxy-6-metoxy-1,4-benzoquinol methylase